ncbi:MAG: glycosyltransferase family 2 protein [Tannerellaceae bacterium]|jgi:GT2 family glycosyltransferase|nr:glycosyltransferase family 2 protein [Tannerellaceae bacterium]
MKKVSVVILNWNGRQLLEQFLPSVINYSPAEYVEVIVADNGSTDDSISMLEEKFPQVGIIRLFDNYGFAEGYNRALERIDSEYTVLLNSDVEVTPGWLDELVKTMDADVTIACVQPKIRSYHNRQYFEYAGAAGGYIDRYGYPFCRGRVLYVVEEDKGQYDMPAEVLWTTGACLFIRTSVYKSEGGLDARFFAHQEEVEMCWRFRCRGYRLMCVPQSVVYHVGGATLAAENPRKTFLNFRNSLLMVYKNISEEDLKPVLRVRFFLDYLAALKFLLAGHPKNARAVYKARKEFHRLLPIYEPIRKENLRKTTVNPVPELMRKSLIAAFYLKGKKTFKAIVPINSPTP